MIDHLIKWPDRDTAIQCGVAMGTTSQNEETGEMETTVFMQSIGLNLAPIGTHSYVSDNSDPENPVVTTVPGHWVLVRVGVDFDLEEALAPIPAAIRPDIVWSSDMTDEDGEAIPRPPKEEAPQNVWA